jgi:hypothetical protein
MDFFEKYEKELKQEIEKQKEFILQGIPSENPEEIGLLYSAKLERLRGLEQALDLFEHNMKVFYRS